MKHLIKNLLLVFCLVLGSFGYSQQTDMYLGIKGWPHDNANFISGIKVVPVNETDYYLIQLFEGNKVDSLQYRRYKEPYTYSNSFNFKFNSPKVTGIHSAIINYMRNDELITHFSITPHSNNNLTQAVTINTALNYNGNLFLSGIVLNCDSIKIEGLQTQYLKTSAPKDTLVPFFLCIRAHEQIVKFAEYRATVLNIENKSMTMLFNSAIPKIAPSISDTIFKDSATTGVLVNFDTAWNVKWHGVGFLPIGLNFQPTNNQFYNLNRILVTGNNFPLNSYNKLASARYKINTDTSPIYFDKQTNGYKFTSITDFSNKGKLINNYWLKHSVVSTQKIQNIFYYKRGFGFLLSKTDSFEFGKNKTSWGKVKPRNCNGPMNCVSLIIVDTISNKINYDFTPENVGNFAYINDSSYFVCGETISASGYYDFDLTKIGYYKIPAGFYISKYNGIGNLSWARNDNYVVGRPSFEFFNTYNSIEYIYFTNSPRQDMDYGSQMLYKLHNDQYTTWITKLNCKPISDFSYSISAGCVDFSSIGTVGASTKWDFGDGKTEVNNSNPTHCYTYNSKFKVKLITSNKCGTDTAIKDVLMTRADLKNSNSSNIKFDIYPNPSNNIFTIKSNAQSYSYEVFSSDGKLILNKKSNELFQNINLEHHTNGIYILKIIQMNKVFVYKLLLQK